MNASATASTTMKRLAAMQLWPLLIRRASAATRGRRRHVGVGQDDERIAAAELEHRLLQLAARPLGHLDPGVLAARQGDRGDARVGDEAADRAGADQQRVRNSPGGKAGVPEDLLDLRARSAGRWRRA